MALLPRLNRLAEQWGGPLGPCQFACVYLLEAHACDEWPVGMAPRDVPQHRSLADRIAAAQAFVDECRLSPCLPLFADGQNSAFNAQYASWPFRFWAISPAEKSGGAAVARVTFKAALKEMAYDLGDLEAWLEDTNRHA
jgi:hypothetical protein